jgi:hypothetical protein
MGRGAFDAALADHNTAAGGLPQVGLCYHFLRRMPDTMASRGRWTKECRNE